MKHPRPWILRGLAFALVGCALAGSSTAQTVTQSITLQPGWNAVWLEVEPGVNDSDSVLTGLPVASVWTRQEKLSSVDFIQNPSEAAFNEAGWQRWLPPHREESFLNNLFTVQANRAYLIKSTNATPVVWNITGRPSLRQPEWVADSFNLRGVPVDPASPPTFLSFFRHSPAHYSSASSQLQKIYQLNSSSGQWGEVAPTDAVRSGAAYWIFTEGASDYLAPLDADVELGDGLDFGVDLTELDLELRNLTPSPINALITDLAGPTEGILAHYSFDPVLGGQWPDLPDPLVEGLGGSAPSSVKLAPRRREMSVSVYESVLSVRDGAGTRLLIPVRVENPTLAAVQGAPVQAASGHEILAGLWVGSATLNAVSEAHSENPDTPTPVRSEMNLRLIVHVDDNGQARLLREVIQMWREGTLTNDGAGGFAVDKPGEYVLLTDDSLIPLFSGVTVRDAEPVGRRISTVGYDFPSSSSNNFLNLAGSFGIGETLSVTLTLPHDHPTNPFKHKYHPDHDNLNARFDGPAVESFETTREITMTFITAPPDGPAVPDFGYNEMGGTYAEAITGVHKNPIFVSGTFRLSRVSLVDELNPSPIP